MIGISCSYLHGGGGVLPAPLLVQIGGYHRLTLQQEKRKRRMSSEDIHIHINTVSLSLHLVLVFVMFLYPGVSPALSVSRSPLILQPPSIFGTVAGRMSGAVQYSVLRIVG